MRSRKDWIFAIVISVVVHGYALASLSSREEAKVIENLPIALSIKRIVEKPPTPVKEVVPEKVPPKPKVVPKKKPLPKKSVAKKVNPSPEVTESAPLEQVNPEVRISYEQMVAGLIARAKRYPRSARRRNKEGEGQIAFTILPNGSAKDIKVIKSTSVPALDREIASMVRRASPFPPFPSDLKKSSLKLIIPIRFELR